VKTNRGLNGYVGKKGSHANDSNQSSHHGRRPQSKLYICICMYIYIYMYIYCIYMYMYMYMEDVLVKLNPGLLQQKLHLTRRRLFYLQNGFRIEKETSKMLDLEYSFIWC
jgi:hypothetical protein